MIFNSVTYLVFLPLAVVAWWSLPRRPRLWMIFGASLVFYGFWRPVFLVPMLASATVDYFAALRIDASENVRVRRAWLALSLFVNLGLLAYFKYLTFFADNAIAAANLMGFEVPARTWQIVLPLGISFYTFETICYTVDVYRRLIKPERDYAVYGSFITYFPHLVAGPILRPSEILGQLSERLPRARLADLTEGTKRILTGLFLKVVLADNVAPVVDEAFAQPVAGLHALDVWTMAFLFGFQIYFDFSAYSHIAIGSARLMGIRFSENFEFPYAAISPRDFWRRWHISLSSWIRDYLYLPLCGVRMLGGSRGGIEVTGANETSISEARRTGALFLTWTIMGFWHGANWTFVMWGLYHATLVFGHRLLSRRAGRPEATGARALLGWAVTLPLAMLGWIPFRATTVGDTLAMFGRVLDPREYMALGLRENAHLLAATLLLLVSTAYLFDRFGIRPLERQPVLRAAAHSAAYAVAIALVVVFLRPIQQFIYFQF